MLLWCTAGQAYVRGIRCFRRNFQLLVNVNEVVGEEEETYIITPKPYNFLKGNSALPVSEVYNLADVRRSYFCHPILKCTQKSEST